MSIAEHEPPLASPALATTLEPPSKLGRIVRGPLYAVARLAARSYICGETPGDAIRVARRLALADVKSTIGYWDGVGEAASSVLAHYHATVQAIAEAQLDSYLSIKAPSLGYSHELVSDLAEACRLTGVRLHFDAMAPESVDRTWRLIEQSAPQPGAMSCTLPARWRRSEDDADWAVDQGLIVRVVKGQWADPDGDVPPAEGYQRIIDRLAGRAPHVAIASHNLPIIRQSLRRLSESNMPASLELLYGLPIRRQIEIARSYSVPVRLYVPYGAAYLPYCLGELKRNPRIAWWLLRDAICGRGTL